VVERIAVKFRQTLRNLADVRSLLLFLAGRYFIVFNAGLFLFYYQNVAVNTADFKSLKL
jgi:hypothetical protein